MTLAAVPLYLTEELLSWQYGAPEQDASTLPHVLQRPLLSVIPGRLSLLDRARNAVRPVIDGISRLPAGWDGERGRPASAQAIDFAWITVPDLIAQGVQTPSIVPVSDGGVSIEWHRGPRQLVVYIPPQYPEAPALANYLDERTGTEWEDDLALVRERVEDHLAADFLAADFRY